MTLVSSHPPKVTPILQEETRPHRFTLDEYFRLAELGFFGDRRVEFIDGEVLDMAPQKAPHGHALTQATYWCHEAFPRDRFWVRGQMTLVTDGSSPEPDLAILNRPSSPVGDYENAEHAVLIIEIADSTLLADTTTKMSLYAAASVKEYWVLSIPDRELIVHRNPMPSRTAKHGYSYAEVRRLKPGQTVEPLAMPGKSLDPAILLD